MSHGGAALNEFTKTSLYGRRLTKVRNRHTGILHLRRRLLFYRRQGVIL